MSAGSGSSSVFYGEEVDRVGEKGSGDTVTVDVQTLLEVFLNVFLTCFNDAAFFCAKEKLLVLRLLSSSARLSGFPNYWIPDYRNFTAINNNDNNNDDNNNNNNNNNSMVS